jgi:hypothetical protein
MSIDLLPPVPWSNHRELLPKSQWQYKFYPPDEYDGCKRIVIGCYVKGPKRTLSYELFRLSDLPNNYISAQDLEAILSNLLDIPTIQRFERLPNYRVGAHAVRSDLV